MDKPTKDQSIWIEIQYNPLDASAAHTFLESPSAGGTAVFVGTTRQWTDGKETARLEYDSYAPMALKKMKQLAEHAQKKWEAIRVCLIHRLGEVPIGEASVITGVSAAHRKEAFEACRYLIDTLKEDVPIWKREHYTGGGTEWIGTPDPSE